MTSHAARFGFGGPRDLLRKLAYDRHRIMDAEEVSGRALAYAVMDCAIGAWSLVDWVLPALTSEQLRRLGVVSTSERARKRELVEALRSWVPTLDICRHLATGAKHFTVDFNPDPKLSTHLFTFKVPRDRKNVFADGPTQRYVAAIAFGGGHQLAFQFFGKVYDGWAAFIKAELPTSPTMAAPAVAKLQRARKKRVSKRKHAS